MSTAVTEKPVPGGKDVLVTFEDGIAWVAINRPHKRNAMSADLAFEMVTVLEALEVDERCGVLVLTGEGDAFSAGMDLKDYFRATDGLPVLERLRVYRANALWQWRMLGPYPKPTIAMVNGWCFGGAFTPLVSCDLAIAAEEATFGLSEINWGIIPAGIVTKAVEQVMNQRDCLYYIMTGETFDGKRAREMGLVNEAVPKAQLRDRVRTLAKVLLEKNPVVLRAAKQAYRHVRFMNWEQSADYLASKMDQVSVQDKSDGRSQGMKQFLDDKTFKPGLGAYKKS